MTGLAQGDCVTVAMEETRALLRPEVGELRMEAGYLDLLGEADPLGPHVSHRVFHSRFLPHIYERMWRPFFERVLFGWAGRKRVDERAIVLEMIDVSPAERVLDVGCGPGNYTRLLAQTTGDGLVVGFDAAARMLAKAVGEGGSNIAYVRGDATSLPFTDGAFDALSCIAAIHMLDEPMVALDEMNRVLAPGGRVALLASCNWKVGAPPKRPGMHVFERNELTSALADRGFVDIKQRVVGRAQFVGARKAASEGVR